MNRKWINNNGIGVALILGLALSLTMLMPININAKENEIPAYCGEVSVTLNDNVPGFSDSEITTTSYDRYGELDKLGRCTTAEACIGTDLMPTEERGSIGMIKPTGWNQNKYEGLIDSEPPYLYNRCHLIGFQLTGENANENNLITGTRYFNESMLPYENKVAEYVKSSGNHVMYRVAPVFEGDNLLCTGVQMEAYSVEDKGKSVSFNVFCYNVQPGVILNYADGSNYRDENYAPETRQAMSDIDESERIAPEETPSMGASYIANKNTKKFHYPSCSSVSDMKEKNKLYFDGSREELIGQGYVPCKRCNP